MASITEPNVAGLYNGDATDSIEVVLHSDTGYPIQWIVWCDQENMYHVFAEVDDNTENFLREYYPDAIADYLQEVEGICTANSKWLSLINSFIASHTYNSIRPLIENEDNWLELNEEELDRD